MPPPPGKSIDADQHDEQLAALLEELTQREAGGEVVDIHAVARERPEFGDELVELWGAVMLANAVGSDASRQVEATGQFDSERKSAASASLPLPCRWGDYELLAEIGRGGMGIVYHARQESLSRDVAVKMIIEGRFASRLDQQRFQKEAESAARLDHPAIVPVYEVGHFDDRPYFTMKYIAGETLQDRIARGPLPPRVAARILAEVAEAIAFAHSQGVLHRDLKPSNIILDGEGRPHVTDFGLAKQIDQSHSLTRTGSILGTPAYMPPEQAAGNRGQVGVQSDVYSLGAMLYAMLTGQPPFKAATHVDTVLQVLEQDAVPPHVLNPRANRDLEMIALKCLQKPPDLRYKSAAALAADLRAFLNDESIAARSGHFSEVFARLLRETHHATVLENWGVLWMWHSLVLLLMCWLTNALYLWDVRSRWPYFLLWTAVGGIWAAIFWALRRRMGPVTFVERQVAHVWAASMAGISLMFPLEYLLGEDVLTLSPVVALMSGMVFLVKAGILTGTFYLQAAVLFATAFIMALPPLRPYAHFIFGVVSALCFFVPGLKYYRQSLRAGE
jgi:eukaryotic-like serine/threonine-protein kinase